MRGIFVGSFSSLTISLLRRAVRMRDPPHRLQERFFIQPKKENNLSCSKHNHRAGATPLKKWARCIRLNVDNVPFYLLSLTQQMCLWGYKWLFVLKRTAYSETHHTEKLIFFTFSKENYCCLLVQKSLTHFQSIMGALTLL